MKRLSSIIVALFATISLLANMQGHFFLNVENENVQVANVENKFAQWLDLPANTTFVQFRDETDNLGIRHLSYQQSVNGTEVYNGIVLVHAKNNVVFAVNGDIMDATIAAQLSPMRVAPLTAARSVRKNAVSSDAKLKIVRAYKDGGYVYRYAYEVLSDDFSSKKYVDAEFGDIIKDIPLKYNADVAGTVTTMYNGTQAITCYERDGSYYLIDEGRGIYTLDATNNTYKINYDNEDIAQELMNVINASSLMVNNSTTWTSTWDYQLKSITISTVLQNSSWYTIGEGQADVYLKIKDKNNSLLYTSGYRDDPTLPVSFEIPTAITSSSFPLSIEIWDYDLIGDDDIVDAFTIETCGGNMYTNNWIGIGIYTNGTYTTTQTGYQPHYDAHWGMEKTLDFYSQKFGRNSYDNQGSVVYQVVNMPRDEVALADFPLNAFAVKTGVYPMMYGTGLVSSNSSLADACLRPLVSIDIMAHEFTHCVTGKNGNGGLEYIGEAGALNESFSDIIGIAVKNYATGSNDWLIGNCVMVNVSNLRSMKNPNNSHDGRVGVVGSPQPKTYNDNLYWVDPTGEADHGGVHTNSGVQNYWFYLLSVGGNGTNDVGNAYSVTGIGIDKAVQIAYRNLIFYLTPEATFEDSRNGSIQAAIDLYGKDSQEHQSVENAWHAVGVGGNDQAIEDSITVKAKMPSTWGTTISAWIWEDGSNGSWATLTKDGEWYSYTTTVNPLNIVFVNGYTWNGDSNQSVDISVTENTCIQLNSNGTNKCTYTVVDCPDEDEITPPAPDCKSIPFTETFASSQGDFTTQNVILPDGLTSIWNWDTQYGMVAKAINGSTKYKSEAWLISPCIELPEEQNCVLTFSHAAKFFSDTDQMTLYLTTDYITEAPGESNWEQLIIPTYPTGTNWNWFESGEIDLSAYKGEHIVVGFRYVSNTNYAPQWEIKNFAITQSGTTPVTPPVESNRYIVLAQRDASSNWFYMTSDLGSASTKRYQAVDAGTNILANVSNTNLADKYYWEIEDNKLKTAAGYSTWTSGNSANLDATGKDLTIQQQADGTYTFSFADGSDTRYLSLNKTAGNDYFAYYKGTAQVYKLTLVKEGTTTPTAIENTGEESLQNNLVRKVIINNQLFILRDGKTYTVQGQEVK